MAPHFSSNRRSPSQPAKKVSLLGRRIQPPFRGPLLVVEESGHLPETAVETLNAAGFHVVRASTVEQACFLLERIAIAGLIVTLGQDATRNAWVRPGLEVVSQLSRDQNIPVALVYRGRLTRQERLVATARNAFATKTLALRHAATRTYLTEFLIGASHLVASFGFGLIANGIDFSIAI